MPSSVCVVGAGDESSDVFCNLPDDDDDDTDGGVDKFTIECSHLPFPSVYYLQLDSRTE